MSISDVPAVKKTRCHCDTLICLTTDFSHCRHSDLSSKKNVCCKKRLFFIWCHLFVFMLFPSSRCLLAHYDIHSIVWPQCFHHGGSDPHSSIIKSQLSLCCCFILFPLYTETAQWSQANRHGQTCDGVQFPMLSNTKINKPGPRPPEEGWSGCGDGGGKDTVSL